MRVFTVGAILLLSAGLVLAAGNREREVTAETGNMSVIGICEPEDKDDTVAPGWDKNPTSGSWGGKDESEFAVVWEPGQADVPDTDFSGGRFAACTIDGESGKTPKKVEMNILTGLANDDFCVFASVAAGDLLVGCFNDTSNTEVWTNVAFEFPTNAFASGQDVTIKILVTGDSWPSFNTWGQLGVDWIQVLGQ